MSIPPNVVTAIKTTSPDELEARGIIQKAKTGYICPHCGNGSGRNGTGVTFTLKGGIWVHNCPRCWQFNGDNIDLFAFKYNLNPSCNFVEICRHACRDLGIAYVEDPYSNFVRTNAPTVEKKFSPPTPTPAELERRAKIEELIRADIAAAQANLHKIPPEYLRGLWLKTLEKHGCGYLPNWIHPALRVDGRKITPTPRLIIPTYGGAHYNAVLPAKFRNPANKNYWKMHAGTMETFALETITATTARVIVHEGELDAMSSYQSYYKEKFVQDAMSTFVADYAENTSNGKITFPTNLPEYAFIATLGAGRRSFVKELDTHCKALSIKPLIVIMYDNDSAGRDGAEARASELKSLGYRAAVKFFKGS